MGANEAVQISRLADDAVTLDEILNLPPRPFAIDTVLPVQGVLVLGGPPKAGKSRLMLDTVLRAMRGRPVFGHLKSNTQSCLVLNAEGGPEGMTLRADAFRDLPKDILRRVAVRGQRPPLTRSDGSVDHGVAAQYIQEWVGFDLVVMDPLVAFHTADENNNQQMAAIMLTLQTIVHMARTSLIVVHHSAKPPQDDTMLGREEDGGMRLRGASAIFGGADNTVMAWPRRAEGQLVLVFDQRYARRHDKLVMHSDRMTGRMYPDEGGVPSPPDWAADWGWDLPRYLKAFGLSANAATLFNASQKANGAAAAGGKGGRLALVPAGV